MQKFKRIPIGLIQKGIEACRINALAYLDDAQMILSKGHVEHAYVSVQLAIEELVKAVFLKERTDEAFKNRGYHMWRLKVKYLVAGGVTNIRPKRLGLCLTRN